MSKPPYSKPANLEELIKQVCARPQMFAGKDNFDLAAAFINGYYFALSEFRPEMNPPSRLNDFGRWLAQQFGYPRNYSWMYFRTALPDDESVFAQLPLLYEKFSKSAE